MSDRNGCKLVRELLPELALGILDGEERAHVLEHAAACAECRRELEGLSSVTDELLELAPAVEPPAGFELRVLGSVAPRRRRPRRVAWRPLAVCGGRARGVCGHRGRDAAGVPRRSQPGEPLPAELATTDGKTVLLQWFGLSGGRWGGAAPVDLAAISKVRLLGDRGRVLLEAEPVAAGSG